MQHVNLRQKSITLLVKRFEHVVEIGRVFKERKQE